MKWHVCVEVKTNSYFPPFETLEVGFGGGSGSRYQNEKGIRIRIRIKTMPIHNTEEYIL
jgi:hypothetical protein